MSILDFINGGGVIIAKSNNGNFYADQYLRKIEDPTGNNIWFIDILKTLIDMDVPLFIDNELVTVEILTSIDELF